MTAFTFVVVGIPQPQGSARAFTYRRSAEKGGGFGARVDSDNPKLKSWRRDVGRIAASVYRGPIIDGPIGVSVDAFLPRPLRLKGFTPAHTTRPDADKIARGILDSLTGIVYRDDSQVAEVIVRKKYAAVGESPRAVITVTPLTEEGRLL